MNGLGVKFHLIQNAVFGAVCAAIIAIFVCTAQTGALNSASPDAKDSYYNLLVQGFRAGQLNVNREPPPGLDRLTNPYDPVQNRDLVWEKDHLCYEMSYYRGKLYLYFGTVPAIVLFWPYLAVTGHSLPELEAVIIFMGAGFLVAAGLVRAIWRRYFAETGIGFVVFGTVAMGLATGILPILSSCDIYEIAKSCGLAFTMLSLAAVWRALHEPNQRIKWLAAASLAFGLAVGSRPSLLFGAVILLVPIFREFQETTERNLNRAADHPSNTRETSPDAPRKKAGRIAGLLAAATGPITLIGIGLLIYNVLRFDDPFEFGWHYQLTSCQNGVARQFSLGYLWFNFRFYFLVPGQWSIHFPFLHGRPITALPSGYLGIGESSSGFLANYPVVWFALFAPLACQHRQGARNSALGSFAAAVFLLFLSCGLTLLLFFAAGAEYELDFLPALMLLAVIGVFAVNHSLSARPPLRTIARWAACLLLSWSVLFNFLASINAHASVDYMKGNFLVNLGQVDEAIKSFRTASTLEPGDAGFHYALANALSKGGRTDESIVQYQKALEMKPNYPEADNNLAFTLLQAGRVDDAIKYFQKALELQKSYQTYYNLAYALRMNRMPLEAETNLQKAIELQPQFLPAQIDLSWTLATSPDATARDGARALVIAENLNRQRPDDPIILRTLAAAYSETGHFPEAVTTAKRALDLARNQSRATLGGQLQAEIEHYESGNPCRSDH
ncbi:MAG TPA: tetratricopeptide repeat protein [Verrucomicrobiae bacterium]|nr:tetratricopeptide repeat protein [Verrucomicrobiae bacterium]